MKKLYNRIAPIWRLLRGRDFIILTLHRRKNQYIVTATDCIDVPSYEIMRRFIDHSIEHLNKIKAELEEESKKEIDNEQ